MLEKPNLSDGKIIAALHEHYGIKVVNLDFLPIGYDANAWVYRVQAEKDYFLKVRRSILNEVGLIIPRYLKDHGVEQVIAPLPTQANQLWATLENFALILYPFIEGDTGMKLGLNENQWIEYGTVLKKVHAVPVSPALSAQMKRETFIPKSTTDLHEILAHVKNNEFDNPFEQQLAEFLRARREEIIKLIERTEELGKILRDRMAEFEFGLCHADIHTANVMLDTDGKLWIVDWDETKIAPKERDLMFIMESIIAHTVTPAEEALFFQGYGKTEIDYYTLAFYRYDWAVQDTAEFAKDVFMRPDVGDTTKQDSMQMLIGNFQPGGMIPSAYSSEKDLG